MRIVQISKHQQMEEYLRQPVALPCLASLAMSVVAVIKMAMIQSGCLYCLLKTWMSNYCAGLTCYDKIISDKQPSIELMILTQDNSMLRTNQKTQCLLESHMEFLPRKGTCPRQLWKVLTITLERLQITCFMVTVSTLCIFENSAGWSAGLQSNLV